MQSRAKPVVGLSDKKGWLQGLGLGSAVDRFGHYSSIFVPAFSKSHENASAIRTPICHVLVVYVKMGCEAKPNGTFLG